MTHTTRTSAVALVVATALILTACSGDPEPVQTDTAQPQPTVTAPESGGEDDTELFLIGQPADNGTFEPLTLPDGISYGDDVIPDDSFIDGSGLLKPGTAETIYSGYWSKSSTYRSTFLFVLDSTTEPLAGADYETAYTELGLAAGGTPHGAPIQQFTYRAREVAAVPGEDDASTFDIAGMMTGFDYLGNNNFIMISETTPLGCVGDPTPFDEHGWDTGDTVQGCGYAVALPGADTSVWFYGLRLNGRLSDDSTAPRMFTTGVQPEDPSAGHDD